MKYVAPTPMLFTITPPNAGPRAIPDWNPAITEAGVRALFSDVLISLNNINVPPVNALTPSPDTNLHPTSQGVPNPSTRVSPTPPKPSPHRASPATMTGFLP